ncbi:hypothetical protein LCGC14_1399140 [marine sediment metagenome]|uniref:Uncharacterized protein n=1 Tax=marine sediment metagenome TaxID=412755 RepID=A0A0F9MD44_9ZZZZ
MEKIGTIRMRALKVLGNMVTTERIALCLTYQVGDLVRAVYRISHCDAVNAIKGEGTSNPRAYYGEARAATADASLQLRLIVNELGFDWDETIALGEEHHKEVMEEVARGERD